VVYYVDDHSNSNSNNDNDNEEDYTQYVERSFLGKEDIGSLLEYNLEVLDMMVSRSYDTTKKCPSSINTAKVLTGVIIFFLGGKYGYSMRSTIYTGLHVSYLCWWMLEQTLFPPLSNRFGDAVSGPVEWVQVLAVVGVFYAFPAWNTFRNKKGTPHTLVSIISIMMFSLGCLINTMADVQMHTTKGLRKGLVTEGIFRLCQNPNWLGDYMRYGSFSLISGNKSSFILVALIVLINFGSLQDPKAKGGMADRYGKAYEQWVDKVPSKL